MGAQETGVRERERVAAPHTVPAEEAAAALGSDIEAGLAGAEAEGRLARYGPNALPEAKGRSLLRAFVDQFASFLILLLLAATVLAAAIGEYLDAATIAAIVVLSAVLGVAQEWRAERALQALRAMMAPTARAVRDGRIVELSAPSLVPGDVVLLDVGYYVPADLRLAQAADLSLNEASLTGESTVVRKDPSLVLDEDTAVADRRNCAFAGTMVTSGRARGIVTATGPGTEMGRIAALISAYEEEQTPLQRRMSGLGRWLGGAAIAISVVIFTVGTATGEDVLDMLLTSVALAVAAVPEGLPAIVTIGLALGMQRMARRNSLVRRLSAVETLGSATVIASDKTGTLTKGEMTAVRLYLGPDEPPVDVTGVGFEPDGTFEREGEAVEATRDPHLRLLLSAAALCNDAHLQEQEGRWRVVGDTTEGALVVAAAKAGLGWEELEASTPRQSEVPFTAQRRRMTTVHRHGDRFAAYMKGAPDVVVPLCTRRRFGEDAIEMSEPDREAILAANEELASQGLRVLAVAHRPLETLLTGDEAEREMVFLGLVAIQDPPRPEAREAVSLCHQAGIRPIMVTGDHAATALAVARDLKIAGDGEEVITDRRLDELDEGALRETVGRVSVYARISPEGKMRIVEALRDAGQIVAVTGDGVNDAPALKRADIGVAMGITGTDVAKEASEMVITDDNFATIVSAVEEGRKIYDNIRNFVVYLLSANIGEIIVIFAAVVSGLPLPLLPMQILWVNLVTDSLPALALVMEPGDPDSMNRPPRPPREPILTAPIVRLLAVRGLLEGIGALAVFVIWLEVFGFSDDSARSVAFAAIVVAELLEAFGSRSLYRTFIALGPLKNLYVVFGTLVSFAATVAVLYVPALQDAFHTEALGPGEWIAVAAVGAFRLAVIELLKVSPWRLRAERG